jgi:hypothetical protein
MKDLYKRFQAWRGRRHLERVARWEQTRAKGKTRVVIRTWIIFSASYILFTSLYDYSFSGTNYFSGHVQPLKIVSFIVAGLIVGLVEWWVREGEYTAAKIDERRKQQERGLGHGET